MTSPRAPGAVTYVVDAALDGVRVDRAVATLAGLPTAAARRLCAVGRVRCAGRRAAAGDRVRSGDPLDIAGVAADGGWFVPTPPLPVLFVDDDLVIVDKPAGMPCHPLVPGEGGTVVDAVVGLFPEVANAGLDPREGGLLHRLDNDTSGCLAFARHAHAFSRIGPRVRGDDVDADTPEHDVAKTYLAVVHGAVATGFVVDAPIAADAADPRRSRIDRSRGRPARTVVAPRGSVGDVSVVELALHGGRRHQLRLHLATQGHPLVGDTLYGGRPLPWSSQQRSSASLPPFLLHAWRLHLSGLPVVQAPVPDGFRAALPGLDFPA